MNSSPDMNDAVGKSYPSTIVRSSVIGHAAAEHPLPSVTDSLPSESILEILGWAINANAAEVHMTEASILKFFHVCSRWRKTLHQDRALCGSVAFIFRHFELVEMFLKMAGSCPLRFDLDGILERRDRTEEHRQLLITSILDDKERLFNAVAIKNLSHHPVVCWLTETHNMTFANLESLEITVNATGINATIHR